MRSYFDRQLAVLNEELTEMGLLIENAISNAVAALSEQDIKLANDAIAYDKEVDRKEKDIESLCLRLLLRQQPVATDLRVISSALKMITDMERIGDQASDIAEIAKRRFNNPGLENMEHIRKMAQETINMVNKSIDAFVKKDTKLAESVIALDDRVDELFDKVKNDLVSILVKDPSSSEDALDLLMVAKYFERIGDHATNIAEWVLFSITGIQQ
ncbi:MAG: phosphate signaling complex protein PhoU [Clostridia bacterium]|nr:phosphate signaling complex protein PhoU [Clostridia bacterium]